MTQLKKKQNRFVFVCDENMEEIIDEVPTLFPKLTFLSMEFEKETINSINLPAFISKFEKIKHAIELFAMNETSIDFTEADLKPHPGITPQCVHLVLSSVFFVFDFFVCVLVCVCVF